MSTWSSTSGQQGGRDGHDIAMLYEEELAAWDEDVASVSGGGLTSMSTSSSVVVGSGSGGEDEEEGEGGDSSVVNLERSESLRARSDAHCVASSSSSSEQHDAAVAAPAHAPLVMDVAHVQRAAFFDTAVDDIPPGLIEAIERGTCVAFVGSGFR